jgi:hypothetical protein
MISNKRQIEIEGRLSVLETKVSEIAENHLVHMSADIRELHAKIDKGILLALTTLLGILTDLALKLLP